MLLFYVEIELQTFPLLMTRNLPGKQQPLILPHFYFGPPPRSVDHFSDGARALLTPSVPNLEIRVPFLHKKKNPKSNKEPNGTSGSPDGTVIKNSASAGKLQMRTTHFTTCDLK